ncbi:hypothetical protein BGZ58_005843 [Dissophora ornata]|nr:hypothetical protein BGZ58_005843 [Dissophora ornata]
MKADQESWMPGLAYVGVAAIGSSALVNRARSMPVKIVTPLAMAAVAGSYFLPAHTDLLKPSWMLSSSPTDATATTSTSNPTSMRDLQQSANETALDLRDKTLETIEDLTQQSQATWDDIKLKGENLAGAYRDVGQDQVNKVVETSTHEVQSWLDKQKTEADKLLHEAALALSSTSSKLSQIPHHDKNISSQQVPENPSSSRWSWWKTSDNVASKSELDSAIHKHTSTSDKNKPMVRRPSADATSTKPEKIVIDKAVSSAAIKGHDRLINRTSLVGKNAEESAIKVHDNVVDAALPRDRQTPNEKHFLEISRQASQSDLQDGQFIVKKTSDEANKDALPKRVRRGSVRKDDHGLKNLDKRAHMLYDGVEHIEHSLDKKIQKALQEEADFWHQQSLKEEANVRGGERAM